jgi:hypothetical protein
VPDEQHPLLDSIRELAEPLEQEGRELLERYEQVQTELGALHDAERALVAGLARQVKREREGVGSGKQAGTQAPAPADPPPGQGGGAEPPSPPAADPPAEPAPQSRAAKTYLRREAIIAFLREVGALKPRHIYERCEEVGSMATLHRDLEALIQEGKLERVPGQGYGAVKDAEGGAEPPQEPPPDPPEGRGSPDPPEAPSEPDSAPEPKPESWGAGSATLPRSPARAARRRRERPHRPQPSAPPPRPPKQAKSRSNGIETPPRPAKRSEPFAFADGDRQLLDVLADRPLTPEGLAIKARRPLLELGPRLTALVAAGYLSRGEQGAGNQVYGRTPRSLPA